jgi:tetratricopeptide (TPR) repeat protein
MGPQDTELGRRVVQAYPFPIAFVYREAVQQAPSAEHQVRGIIHTFTVAIQYAAMICVSDYVRMRDEHGNPLRDPEVSDALGRLKRPLLSHFFGFVLTAVEFFRKKGAFGFPPRVLVSELDDFARRLEQVRTSVPVWVDNEASEKELLLRTALVELRNTLGHKLYQADWDALAAEYLPHLHSFLRLMEWSQRYPLYRLAGARQWALLRGAEPSFPTVPIPDEAFDALGRMGARGMPSDLVLCRPSAPVDCLGLYPLLVMEPCPSCARGPLVGLESEVFQFNGDEGPHLTYLGMRHSLSTKEPRAAIDALYASTHERPPVVAAAALALPQWIERATRQSGAILDQQIRAFRDIPGLSLPRPEIEAALGAFLDGPLTGLCLLGEAGSGKTCLACRIVRARLDRDVVLFYEGRGLFAQGDLEARIHRDLYLKNDDFPALLSTLRRLGMQLVLVVDGIAEDDRPADSLQGLCDFILRYAAKSRSPGPGRPLKVLFTARTAAFEAALSSLMIAGAEQERQKLFPAWAFATREMSRDGQTVSTHRFIVEPLGQRESREWYEAYRRTDPPLVSDDDGAGEGNPGELSSGERPISKGWKPLTPYDELEPALRPWLRQPWFLRVMLETFHGEAVPSSSWANMMVRRFCAAKIYGQSPAESVLFADRAAFIHDLIGLFRTRRITAVHRGADFLPTNLNAAIAERQRPLSAYLQLVSEGVLCEFPVTRTEEGDFYTFHNIVFSSDSLLVYLLSEWARREAGGWAGLTPQRLAALIREGSEFEPMARAAERLLVDLAQRDHQPDRVVAALDAADSAIAVPLAVRVLVALAALDEPAQDPPRKSSFEKLVDALYAAGQPARVAEVLVETARALLARSRPEQARTCTAAAICEKCESAAGVATSRARMLDGVALMALGRLADALPRLDGAIDGLHSAGGVDLVKALINRANVLQSLRKFGEAERDYAGAVSILDNLAASAAEPEEHLRPLALLSLGVALMRQGRVDRALANQQAAVTLLDNLVGGRGRLDLFALQVKSRLLLGATMQASGLFEAAAERYREVLARLDAPPETAHSPLNRDHAVAMMNLGVVLDKLPPRQPASQTDRFVGQATGGSRIPTPEDAAISYLDRSVELLRGVVNRGHEDARGDLAIALVNRSKLRLGRRRHAAAVADIDEAIAFYSALLPRRANAPPDSPAFDRNHSEYPFRMADFCHARRVKVMICEASGGVEEALDLLDEAICDLMPLESSPDSGMARLALNDRARLLRKLGRDNNRTVDC